MEKYNKAVVALIMAVLGILDVWFGVSWGLNETIIASVIFVLSPILIYLVPNR